MNQPNAPQAGACTWCGRPMDPSQAVYSKRTAQLVCRSCEASESINDAYIRAARSVVGGAVSAGFGAIFSPFMCNFMGVVTPVFAIGGLIASIQSFRLLNRPEYKQALGTKRTLYVVGAAGALVASLIGALLAAAALLGLASVFRHRNNDYGGRVGAIVRVVDARG